MTNWLEALDEEEWESVKGELEKWKEHHVSWSASEGCRSYRTAQLNGETAFCDVAAQILMWRICNISLATGDHSLVHGDHVAADRSSLLGNLDKQVLILPGREEPYQPSLRNNAVGSPSRMLMQEDTSLKDTTLVQKMQGPWGSMVLGSVFSECAYHMAALLSNDPITSCGITAIRFFFKDPDRHYLSAFRVTYDLNGLSREAEIHGRDFNNGAYEHIKIGYPQEFIVQVKGSFVTEKGFCGVLDGPFLTSLIFITNFGRTLGPYGDYYPDDAHMAFSSEYGKVVGFFGVSGWYLEKIGVLIAA